MSLVSLEMALSSRDPLPVQVGSLCVPTSVKEEKIISEAFAVYPNPSTGVFTLRGEGNFSYQVKDILGRILREEKNATASHEVTVSGFAKGIYFVNIFSKNKNYLLKTIVQ